MEPTADILERWMPTEVGYTASQEPRGLCAPSRAQKGHHRQSTDNEGYSDRPVEVQADDC